METILRVLQIFKDTKSRILNEKDPETIIKELEGVKKNFSEAVLY